MVPNAQQATFAFKCVIGQCPGGAITCPYCQGAVEYDVDGKALLISELAPLRYSRAKMEARVSDYGSQKSPPDATMIPEQWIAEDKLMSGALEGYRYVEDDAR
jgi:hypothetical protein